MAARLHGESCEPGTMNEATSPQALSAILLKIATKTMYGHTIGEVLALSVALERTVDKVCAASLAQGEWAQETLIELVLDQIRGDQKLKVLRQVLVHAGHCHPDALVNAIREVVRLRNDLAHSALVDECLDEQGWVLSGRRRDLDRSVHIPVEQVTLTIDAGSRALDGLLRLVSRPTGTA